jgi:hypothetical protein
LLINGASKIAASMAQARIRMIGGLFMLHFLVRTSVRERNVALNAESGVIGSALVNDLLMGETPIVSLMALP